jgi:hypothetical protein
MRTVSFACPARWVIVVFSVVGAATASSLLADPSDISVGQSHVDDENSRFRSAELAEENGNLEFALHELAVCLSDPKESWAAESVFEMHTRICQGLATESGQRGDSAAQIKRVLEAYQFLLVAKTIDEREPNRFSRAARKQLFDRLTQMHADGKKIAQSHLDTADRLRQQAKGKHFWSDDNESQQAEALHANNLAWACYPCCDHDIGLLLKN